MTSIRSTSIRIAIATALAAGAALSGVTAAHYADGTRHGGAVTTVVRQAEIIDCCE